MEADNDEMKGRYEEMLNQYAQNPPPREPTGDECYAEKIVPEFGMYAAWYPQMGGYSAKCWIEASDGEDGCFDAWVYHDGTFPFDSKQVFDDEWGQPQMRQPAKIHHCSATQFIEFGSAVQSMLRKSE